MTEPKKGNLSTTLATWIFLLDCAGHRSQDPAVIAACDGIRIATPADADTFGQRLVGAVRDGLGGDDTQFDDVVQWIQRLYGDKVTTAFGANREARIQAIRSEQYRTRLPWVAAIIDRFPDGSVGPHWVMVEQVTDTVRCMDPYPWDDLDEEYEAPLLDFFVKWELAGGVGLRFTG